jgi:hypothetical protein
MDAAIEAVETIKQKKEEEVKKLDDALEILQGVDLGNANQEGQPITVDEEVENISGPFKEEPVNTTEINDNKPEEEGIIENTLSGITDAFSPKPEAEQGGKRKNRKSRKGLRTKRFRGGYRRKTRRGRRNSRRLRK